MRIVRLPFLLAVSAGVSVACNYCNQAMLLPIAAALHGSPADVASIPAVTQAANACGILFLAPLGDVVERKGLILVTAIGLIVALLASAAAPNLVFLILASAGVGLFASMTQQLVPVAVRLAEPTARGRALGVVTSGILSGILLARAASGILSDLYGWRVVFLVAAGAVALAGAALARGLPPMPNPAGPGYGAVIRSLWDLPRVHPRLRRCALIQALLFAGFMGFWTNVPFLLAEPGLGLGATAVGLLALIGMSGALAAPALGTLVDRRGARTVVTAGAGGSILAFLVFGLFGHVLAILIGGVVLLDLAIQGSQIANQSRVYRLDKAAPGRLNTIFMASMLGGGAVGSTLATLGYARLGWWGPCGFGMVSAGAALLLASRRDDARAAPAFADLC